MCGIVGYIGNKDAVSILLKGLQRLEYRGYDSAGIACIKENAIQVFKTKGKVSDLKKIITEDLVSSSIGIGHTRWATHGPPNQVNAHPHFSGDGSLALIHNGIIENYSAIKSALESKGHEFVSETDTEVLVHLIEDIISNEKISLFEAVRVALDEVIGAYAIIVMQKGKNDEFVAARKGSPLVIGVGRNEYYVASDATPIVEYTNNVIYLEDGHIARINKNENIEIKNIKNKNITPYVQELKLNIDAIEKGGFSHFMLKEIYEQPSSIRDTMRGRIDPITKEVKLGGILEYQQKIVNANRIIIVACGTSWHAGLIGEYIIEDFARIPVEVEYASEFRYRNPIISSKDIVLAISQSGETADTLAAISLAKEKGATILGICNVVGSSIARLTHAGIYTHAGPEIGVASTKAFTTQVIVLILMALKISQNNGNLTLSDYHQLIRELELIPSKVKEVLKINEQIKKIAFEFKDATNFLYLGRGYNFPVALEGALKLKEISYIHAEGYPAAEMKHGPIALIDENMPTIIIATNKNNYEKIFSNAQEIKARSGKLIAILAKGDNQISKIADHVIEVPQTNYYLSPLINTIPLQLFSYYIATYRGCNVDQPRNLAKSVTVE